MGGGEAGDKMYKRDDTVFRRIISF